jgi:hypothetical protein
MLTVFYCLFVEFLQQEQLAHDDQEDTDSEDIANVKANKKRK